MSVHPEYLRFAGHVKSYLVSPGFVHGLATGKLVEAGIINPVPTVLLGVAMGALGSGQGRLVGPQKNIWHAVHIDDRESYFQSFSGFAN